MLPVDPTLPPNDHQKAEGVSVNFNNEGGKDWLFGEFFAGEGGLTKAMKDVGINVLPPDELSAGGTDFSDNAQVEELKTKLWKLSRNNRLALHFAPPCATFSRARDRSKKTRLRSSRCPGGLLSKRSRTKDCGEGRAQGRTPSLVACRHVASSASQAALTPRGGWVMPLVSPPATNEGSQQGGKERLEPREVGR